MNAPLTEPGLPSTDQRVVALMAAVERLVHERRDADALRLLHEAESLLPEHPLVLHEHGRRRMVAGDAGSAYEWFTRAVAGAPRQIAFHLSQAAALRSLGWREDELKSLEQALALDPTHLVALLQKGALLDLMRRPRAAAEVYANALHTLAPGTRLSPGIEAHVRHAESRVQENSRALAALIDARLEALQGVASPAERKRFDRCMDRMLGRKRIYTPEPTSLLFPYLRNYEYFDREAFPWLEALEAATDTIRDELLCVLGGDQEGIQPYIAYEEGLPLKQWRELNHSRRWGASFLLKEGRREESHIARCPRTLAALEQTTQVDIPGTAPTAFFSILDAHTRIPPHTGVTNTRLTVHLPLVVPGGCRFRVGGETREWREGTAWVFDDTIEHEAWNDSDQSRAILIFDVWNPELTELERSLVREATVAVADYRAAETDQRT
jgi:aspartyl/asparaginyl beta-hydroxylase (cupin superfamily)